MRSPLVAATTLVAFLLCALPPAGAWADDGADLAAAKQHFEAGRAAYLGGDYGRAITEFQAAQSIRPSPILDYNIGLSYEALGDGNNAFAAFERYLNAKPDAQNRADVEQRMYAIQQRLSQQQQQPTTPPGATAPPQGTSGADPYSQGYYQQQPPQTPPQEPAPPQNQRQGKKSSNWWVIFPILGGVALTAAIITVAVVASNNSCTPPNCGGSYAHALSNLPSDPRTTINAAVPAAGLRF